MKSPVESKENGGTVLNLSYQESTAAWYVQRRRARGFLRLIQAEAVSSEWLLHLAHG